MNGRLERLAEAVREASGIALDRGQLGALRSALARVLPGAEPEAVLEAFEDQDRAPGLLERIVDEVTVKESYFMREAAPLHAVDWLALLDRSLARGSDRVRVWSAGCADGQEPYTLAILASEAFGSARPPVEVVATDVSGTALERASRGTFSRRAVRGLPPDILEDHFDVDDDGFEVRAPLRDLVSFRRHNLARDPKPPAAERTFDLVVCRNVLIYFDAEAVHQALSTLEAALAHDGLLLLGAADRLCVPHGRATPASSPLPGRVPERDRARPRRARQRRARGRGRDRRREKPDAADALRRGQGVEPSRPVTADLGDVEAAMAAARDALSADPLSGEAYFLRATVEMAMGQPEAAIASLRAALYASPDFGLAAFQLGRAYEAVDDLHSARRAYEQALRTLDREDRRHYGLVGDVDIGDVAYACGVRIRELARSGAE